MELDTILLIVGLIALVAAVVGGLLHKTLLWRSSLVVAALSLCGGALYPPDEKLQAGPDLAGGTSLLYEIDTTGATDTNRAILDTIEVLKKRVDPTGVRNLEWRQEGGNRIEITMPRPSEVVQQRRDSLREIEKTIEQQNIPEQQLETLLNSDGTAFQASAETIAAGVPGRLERLSELKQAHDNLRDLEQQLEQLPAEEKIDFVGQVTAAQRRFEQLRAEVLETNLQLEELRAVMNRPVEPQNEGEPSPREAGIAQLKQDHPARADQIEIFAERYLAYQEVKGQLDDASDLIRLLKGSGVLEFRIPVQPGEVEDVNRLRRELTDEGPGAVGPRYRWVRLAEIEEFAREPEQQALLRSDPAAFFAQRDMIGARYGENIFVLMWDTLDRSMSKRPQQEGWSVTAVHETIDSNYLPAVMFELNPRGARFMSRLTGENIGRPMAVILDGRVMSAPVIQGQLSDTVTITNDGGFSRSEVDYLRRTLQAGSLAAKLSPEPLSIRTLGPSLGADNLRKGLEAARDALIAVAIFMVIYFFFAGAVADLALFANVVIILGIMAFRDASFTLPGIAGIVLTIGMCVDANVLVFERIREEQNKGADLPTAIRLGYSKALSAIIDGNLTNLIVCIILYQTATVEVRGFAVTLGIGILATLFTSLFMTRTIFLLWNELFGMKDLNQLPSTFKAIDRFLTPSISWMRKRIAFFAISGVAIVASIVLCFAGERGGVNLLDIEFRAGSEVAFTFAQPEEDEGEPPVAMTLAEVRERKDELARLATVDPTSLTGEARQMAERIQELIEARREEMVEQSVNRQIELGNEPTEAERQAIVAEVMELTGMTDLMDGSVRTIGEGVGRDEQTGNQLYTGFSIVSTVEDPNVVSAAVKVGFEDLLDTQPSLTFAGMEAERLAESPAQTVGGTQGWNPPPGIDIDLDTFRGGVAIPIRDVTPAISVDQFAQRLQDMRLQDEFETTTARQRQIIPLQLAEGAANEYTDFVVLISDPQISSFAGLAQWQEMAQEEWDLVRAALQRETSLEKVSSFSPTVAETLRDRAIVAIILSLLAIIAYIWFRFGSLRYGLAATAAIVHDTTIALGFFALAQYVAMTGLGEALLVQPFKINLGVIAALLTLIGYSLNDTIVVFDRIRENRGRLAYASPAIIDKSINQTISRTVLTSGTTLLAVVMLYIFGGEGIRGFAFTLFIGVLVGTWSSIAIASPLLTFGLTSEDLTKMQPEPEQQQDSTEPAPEPGV